MLRDRGRGRGGGGGVPAFSPLALSPMAWFDASNAASIISSGGAVSQWSDLSGNGYHATQGTGASQPITGTRTVNGLNGLDFDGTNDQMTLPAGLYGLSNGANTAYAVVVWDSDATTQRPFSGSMTAGAYKFLKISATLLQGEVGTGLSNRSVTSDLVNPHIYELKSNVSSVNMTRDGAVGASLGAPVFSNMTDFNISFQPGVGDWVNGIICEIFFFNRELTTAERNQIGNYLERWGATWTDV